MCLLFFPSFGKSKAGEVDEVKWSFGPDHVKIDTPRFTRRPAYFSDPPLQKSVDERRFSDVRPSRKGNFR
jgi:hypothetical protein